MKSDKPVPASCYAAITCTARTVWRDNSKTRLLLKPRTEKIRADWQIIRQRFSKKNVNWIFIHSCEILSGLQASDMWFCTGENMHWIRTFPRSWWQVFGNAFRDEWQTQNSIKFGWSSTSFLGGCVHLTVLTSKYNIKLKKKPVLAYFGDEPCEPPG